MCFKFNQSVLTGLFYCQNWLVDAMTIWFKKNIKRHPWRGARRQCRYLFNSSCYKRLRRMLVIYCRRQSLRWQCWRLRCPFDFGFWWVFVIFVKFWGDLWKTCYLKCSWVSTLQFDLYHMDYMFYYNFTLEYSKVNFRRGISGDKNEFNS